MGASAEALGAQPHQIPKTLLDFGLNQVELVTFSKQYSCHFF